MQAPSDPQTLNRYSYTRNNPLKYVDPSGHCFVPPVTPVCAVLGLGLLAAGAIYYATTPPPRIDFLTHPLDVAGPIATHTAGAGPQIDPAPALGYPLGPVQGVGASEAYPLAGESGGLQLTTPLPGSATLQIGGPLTAKIRNSAGDTYPSIKDPRTGRNIEFPDGQLTRVSPAERVNWGPEERGAYIKEWYDRGFKTPKGGWERYDIHHIKPREFGGTNDFWNLVPVERSKHKKFNKFWERFP